MFISTSVGLAFAFMPRTENREAVLKVLFGLQELLFTLIKALLYVLPIGILALHNVQLVHSQPERHY
jgi:Na+/H+-dicarboxylate symporter